MHVHPKWWLKNNMNTHVQNKLVLKIAASMIFVFVIVLALINQPTFLVDWQRSKAYKEVTG